MKLQGFIGPAYQLPSVSVDAQRCVNLYPEVIESGNGKGGQVAYLKSTPGLEELFSLGDGPIRLVHRENFERDNPTEKNIVYVFSGSKVFACSYQSGAWQTKRLIRSALGEPIPDTRGIDTEQGLVSAHSIKVGPGNYKTFFVDGDKNYLIESTDNDGGGSQYATIDVFSLTPVLGASQITWIDGYLILIKKNSNQFFVSEWSGLTFDPLNFATAEGNPDNISAISSLNRDLWVFNTQSTEIWTNTGNADFPFERVQAGYIDIGCAASSSVAKTADTILWLGRDATGFGIVYAARGPTPQRISTHAIEYAISSYSNIASARAFTYQANGHSFYVLNFDEATWVYDLSTGMWHERAYLNGANLERHRADTLAYMPDLNIFVCGDYKTNKVYELDGIYLTDNGQEIKRIRSSPHLSDGENLNTLFFSEFQVDVEAGVGLDGVGQGTDPQVMLRTSSDGGKTWTDARSAALGKLGEYKTRCKWRRLGSSYDRIFEVSITDPVPFTVIDANVKVMAGSN